MNILWINYLITISNNALIQCTQRCTPTQTHMYTQFVHVLISFYLHLWFTFAGGSESELSETELLLLCPLLLSCGGQQGATCKSGLLDIAEESSLPCSLPPSLGDMCLLTLGFGLDTRACFTVFGSWLKSLEIPCFPGALLIFPSLSLNMTRSVGGGW